MCTGKKKKNQQGQFGVHVDLKLYLQGPRRWYHCINMALLINVAEQLFGLVMIWGMRYCHEYLLLQSTEHYRTKNNMVSVCSVSQIQ